MCFDRAGKKCDCSLQIDGFFLLVVVGVQVVGSGRREWVMCGRGLLGSGGLVRSFDWCCGARRRRGDGVRPETAGTEGEMTEDVNGCRCTKSRFAFLAKYGSVYGLGHDSH